MGWIAMPVLRQIRDRFAQENPRRYSLGGLLPRDNRNSSSHPAAGGLLLIASNPLSTQDDVAASFVADHEIPVFSKAKITKPHRHLEIAPRSPTQHHC